MKWMILGISLLLPTFLWAESPITPIKKEQKTDSKLGSFLGFWAADFEAAKANLEPAEAEELGKLPAVFVKMMTSIVFEIQPTQVVAYMMGKQETATCSKAEVKANQLKMSCTSSKFPEAQDLLVEVQGSKLKILQMKGRNNDQISKLVFKKVSKDEGVKIAASGPSEEEFAQAMMELMQKSFAQQLQKSQTQAPLKKK